MEYLTTKEAAERLSLSQMTIRQCVSNGAPVHRWGAAGRQYRIVLDEFITWMNEYGKTEQEKRKKGGKVISFAEAKTTAQKAQERQDMIDILKRGA